MNGFEKVKKRFCRKQEDPEKKSGRTGIKMTSIVIPTVLAGSMLATALACGWQPFSAAVPQQKADQDVNIIYTNDVHSYIDGAITYSKAAGLKNSTPHSLLVDAGDHIQGTAFGSMDRGASIVNIMNTAGYDAATLGNHEFDYGMSSALNAVSLAKYDYLSCNFFHSSQGVRKDLVLKPYKIFDVDGVKIAVVGVTTPESFTKSVPRNFQDENGNFIYDIAGGTDGQDLYDRVQEAVDEADKKADYVIGIGHLGDNPSSNPWRSEDVIEHTSGFDAFIDGHSHSTVPSKNVTDKEGHSVLLTQTGSSFDNLGKMTISSEGKISTQLLTADDLDKTTPDAATAEAEKSWMGKVDEKLGVEVGSFTDEMSNYTADGTRLVRSQETNTGDFCTDALYHLFDQAEQKADCAIINGGKIRNKNLTGKITYKTCMDIQPSEYKAYLKKVSGQQLLDALEWGAKDCGQTENGGFLQVSGIKYKIDTKIASTVQKDSNNEWCGAPTGEYRVKDVQILDRESGEYKPLDVNATYNLAGYDYILRDFGGGFTMFKETESLAEDVKADYMVLADYVQTFEKGIVSGYASVQNRIEIE
ncbi:MAG: bifunctional metallophosphatase/5'-nucleotidase [Ileibacterium sp.]|nr:bifunctional metallophosphatase/5'-nucleotidase [Ileibacterium sp.]